MSGRRTAVLAAALGLLALYFAVFERFSVERPAPAEEGGAKILDCQDATPSELSVTFAVGSISAGR